MPLRDPSDSCHIQWSIHTFLPLCCYVTGSEKKGNFLWRMNFCSFALNFKVPTFDYSLETRYVDSSIIALYMFNFVCPSTSSMGVAIASIACGRKSAVLSLTLELHSSLTRRSTISAKNITTCTLSNIEAIRVGVPINQAYGSWYLSGFEWW